MILIYLTIWSLAKKIQQQDFIMIVILKTLPYLTLQVPKFNRRPKV